MNNSRKALNGSKTSIQFSGDDDGRQLKRFRHNCLQCRKAKTKCDRARPSCKRCVRLGYECLFVEVKRGRMYIPLTEDIPLEQN